MGVLGVTLTWKLLWLLFCPQGAAELLDKTVPQYTLETY